jgi:hypothetical protein
MRWPIRSGRDERRFTVSVPGPCNGVGCPLGQVGVQAEDVAGDGGTQAARPAGQGGCAFLAPDSGAQDSERDHENGDHGDG